MRLYMHTKCLIIKQNNTTNKIDFCYKLKIEKSTIKQSVYTTKKL